MFSYTWNYIRDSGLVCPIFYVNRPNANNVVFLHVFDNEIKPTIAQLDLLFQHKPMEINLLFTKIVYDGTTISFTTFSDDNEPITIVFPYIPKIYEQDIKRWYTYLQKRPIKTDKDYVCEKKGRYRHHWYASKRISTVTRDVVLCIYDQRNLSNYFNKEYISTILYVGIPSIHNWHSVYFAISLYETLQPLISLALLLQGKSATIYANGHTIAYACETNTLTFTKTFITVFSITYIPEYHRQIFKRAYNMLCKTLLRLPIYKQRCGKFWLSGKRIQQKISAIVVNNPTIDPNTLVDYL